MKYINFRVYLLFVLFILAFTLGGCAVKRPLPLPLASIEGISGHFRMGRIIRMESGKVISFDQLITELESNDLIFVGEIHDNPEHHLIQVQILQALLARHSFRIVAMEFFQEPQQTALDSYIHGTNTEDEFLEHSDWLKQWGFDYHFYRPLIFMVKEKGAKILAINAPINIVRKVARSGLDSLEPNERAQLASSIDLNNQDHRTYLQEVYEDHEHGDLQNFDYFYQAQCVWEDTMAENIAEYLKKNRGKMVVFAGNGHIINKFGIPDRVLKRVEANMATVILYPLTGRLILKKGVADYVWLTGNDQSRRFMMRNKRRHNNMQTSSE